MIATETATVTDMIGTRESRMPYQRFGVLFDSGAMVDIVSRRDAESVYARSNVSGLWYLVTRTGSAVRQNMVRVRVVPATDPGYADDTVVFDARDRFGGRVNRDVFGL